jgi:pimeloyl-ACP methyl ester carboxylesterase
VGKMHIIWLILKWVLILVIVLLIVGVIYEQYSQYSATKNFVDNGTYVEVDGYKMHYLKRGEGKTTVIFESGLDFAGHLSWGKVQDEISKSATTISYDRAGILRSQSSNKPRTCENIANELYELKEKLGVNESCILVVHSLGGLIARCYAKKYISTLKGVVFVDASHPDQLDNLPTSIKAKMKPPAKWIGTLITNLGISRVATNKMTDKLYRNIENIKSIKAEINKYLITSSNAAFEELKMVKQMTKAAKGATFKDIPFRVLTAIEEGKKGDEKIFFEHFSKLQTQSLELSTNSKQTFVKSGHYIQLEKPEVVIEAIRNIVEENKKDIKK